MARKRWLLWTVPLLCALGLAGFLRYRSRGALPPLAAPAMSGEPRTMLWAWEVPEDLRSLDPEQAGVAFLAREVFLNHQVSVRSRRQPLYIAHGTWLMAVVRIEETSGFIDTPELRRAAADAVLGALAEPGVRALQIDFDAVASQQNFYRGLLAQLQQAMPPGMPLSITALVSWCGPHGWLDRLSLPAPVGEAVPMFFRMGGPAALRATRPRDTSRIRAAPCRGSVGVSTDEVWPPISPAQRVYVFRPGPWTKQDIAQVSRLGYVGLQEPPS